MSKLWFWVVALLCAAAMALSLVWMAWPRALIPEPDHRAEYLLADRGGRLALVPAQGGEPVAVYQIYTRLLPEEIGRAHV